LKSREKNPSVLISIVTPVYNSSHYIKETIASVLEQTYSYWEMIIIDDFSDDESRNIIEDYVKKDKRIKALYNEKNIGTAQSRNRGIKLSKGKYIAFLDSDDTWLPKKLERQLKLMKEKNIPMSYVAYYTMDHKNTITAFHPVEEQVSYTKLLKNPSMIGTLTMIYDTEKLGKFYFKNIGHEDYIVKLKILKKIDFAVGINEPLAKYRIHNNSLSSNKIHAAKWVWNIYRDIEKLSLIKSLFYFLHYIYYSFTKYKKL
jgi:glycosyltransferase involved in cell wall biosynthesis